MKQQSRFTVTKNFLVEETTLKTPMSFMHYHETYELYYVLNGNRDYFIGNEFFTASDGDFVIVPKNTLHRTDGKGATRILIYFSESFLLDFFSQDIVNLVVSDIKPSVFHPTQEDSNHFYSIAKSMLNEYTNHINGTKTANNTILAAYLYELLLDFTYKKNTYTAKSFPNEKVSAIIKYIDANYRSINNLDEIVERFFISKYYLCRIFYKYLGVSIITYLNMVKVRASCEMIKSKNMKLVDIAMECGFNTSAYFSTVFRQEMGMSPRDYKNQIKKG